MSNLSDYATYQELAEAALSVTEVPALPHEKAWKRASQSKQRYGSTPTTPKRNLSTFPCLRERDVSKLLQGGQAFLISVCILIYLRSLSVALRSSGASNKVRKSRGIAF